jgi:uncharacterized membrane protein
MAGPVTVLIAAASFLGTHVLLSHPLRAPLVRAIGEKGFLALYSLVAFATLGATISAYRAAPAGTPLWGVGDGLWALATLAMLAASVLFMGSLIRNPALPGTAAGAARAEPRGVFAVTRHPMMWSFALWGVSHILVHPVPKNIVLSGAIVLLALAGSALQDRKKAALDPQSWPAWESRTSFLPFAAILRGRARLGGFGGHALGGGLVVWLAATWAHIPLAGWPAGIWRWLG